MADTAFTAFVFFGSLVCVPLLLFCRSVLRRWRWLLFFVALHLLLIGAAFLLVWLCRVSGYRDWIYARYYLVVINVIMSAAYGGLTLICAAGPAGQAGTGPATSR
jgi:hypothetical protein